MSVGISVARAVFENGFVGTTTYGNSMYPMLRNQRDCVIIKKAEGALRPDDVVLYLYKDRYILHRIIRIDGDICVIRGDNCVKKEYIPKKDIIGVVQSFERNGKSYDCKSSRSYRCYCVLWRVTAPLRIGIARLKMLLYKLYRRLRPRG